MANPYFQFKQFTVWHDLCAMKVGTDGVLLGAWASVEGRRRILDVGTGTGLIALMAAQRNGETLIDAVEIDADAARQAEANFAASPWADRLHVILSDFSRFDSGQRYDLIVSNPPYFESSLTSPGRQRTLARHTASLPFEALIASARSLLAEGGLLALVYPADADERIRSLAIEAGLRPRRRLAVRGTPDAPVKRVLAEYELRQVASPMPEHEERAELTVELARHEYTLEYIALTRAFYLKM